MALINCPGCAHKVSGQAVSCPKCGRAIAAAVNPAGFNEDGSFYGSVRDFGIKKCIKTESKNFWLKRRFIKDIFASKAHSVDAKMRINITRGQVLKMWALGLFGALGIHYFFAGRLISGSTRFLYGFLMLAVGVIVALAPQETQEFHPLRILLVFVFFALLPSVWDLAFILPGKFRDVFRNYIGSVR